ncbi:unnamed protein product [Calypogeia fissa]
MKAEENGREMCGGVGKSRARACTRSERAVTRGGGLIAASETGDDVEIKENCMATAADMNWTKHQERALQESLSSTKPGVNFWRLVAERVPGKSADDCLEKFYSGRNTTRAAKRSRTLQELDSALPERNGSKRVKSLQRNAHMNAETPRRETRASRQAATGAANKESKTSDKGYSAGALTRQTGATRTKGTKRRIELPSNSLEVKRFKATEVETKATTVAVSPKAKKGSRNRAGKQVLIEKARVPPNTPAGRVASGLDRSSDSDDIDESDAASGFSVDDDLWTEEQELILHKAYATIKPSAKFWHFISKQVPGRSAEVCFDKFYSEHPTPQRKCLKEVYCPASLPRPTKTKVTGSRRLVEAHRTVRNILRRQQIDDEDYKADAFAALEPPDVVHSVSAVSNETDLKLCLNRSLPGSMENSTTHCPGLNKENRKLKRVGPSREFGIGQSQVSSPEILKEVKDPLMLDKYIDHLHQRRSRRTGIKSAHKKESAQRPRGVNKPFKDGLGFREVRLDAVHYAKQELRDLFLRPTSAIDDPFLNLLTESSDGNDEDDEEDTRNEQSVL